MVRPPSERAVLWVIGAVQFINILDFVMVAPLGPDFARALGIPLAQIGYVFGSYTASAALAGLAGSFFLDRFDRKKALLVALGGLVTGTALGGFATGLYTLMAARFLAGAFGGPATSLAMSIVADLVPAERRGRALGAVMSAFSIASVLGVPAGLRLALWGGWRMPFLAVAAAGAVIALAAAWALPSLRGHLEAVRGEPPATFARLAGRSEVLLSWTMTAVVMAAGFIIIPNLSTHVQYNLGFPRENLELLYLVGGAASFLTLRLGGWLVDRFGSFVTATAAAVLMEMALFVGFVRYVPHVPVLLLFPFFMVTLALRNVAYNTLTSKVPTSPERARFMSIQSAVQHLASAAGAFASVQMLSAREDGTVAGMDRSAMVSMALTAILPLLMRNVERRVRRRAMPARSVMQPHEVQSGITPGSGVRGGGTDAPG
jgi:predicted MFS family arabinose efflux permease